MADALNIVYLPEHILIQIFSYMSYGEISEKREVCQTFNRICSKELTKAFFRVDRLHGQIQKNIKSQLPRKESERRNHALSRFVDVLSAMETRLSLLSMTYTKYIDLDLCCFIPGKVLDEMYLLLRRLQNTDTQPPRSYDLLQGLRDLSTMAMEHFEECIVPALKAQINDRSQSLYFSTPNASASSPLHSSLGCTLDNTGISVVDYSNSMSLSMVSSPWRRTPLKLDVQRLQSQMQMHSAAIATMTKEHHEQKVKMAEQSRVIAEKERQLQEQSLLILELKAHMQAQEKNLESLAAHLTAATGQELVLPETKAWDQSLWDCSLRISSSSQDSGLGQDGPMGCDVVDKDVDRRKPLRQKKGRLFVPQRKDIVTDQPHCGGRRQSAVDPFVPSMEQAVFHTSELQESLSSKCSTKRLLAQIALTIQRITADHSLPLCLEDGPKALAADPSNPKSALLEQLGAAQKQLSTLHEEHVGCSLCSQASTSSGMQLQSSACDKESDGPSSVPSVPNQGLVNRAQELYNKLTTLTVNKCSPEAIAPADGSLDSEINRRKVRGKGPLKRGRCASKDVVEAGGDNMDSAGRKRRRC